MAESLRPSVISYQFHNTIYQGRENDLTFISDLQALAEKSLHLTNLFTKKTEDATFTEVQINTIAENAELHDQANRPAIQDIKDRQKTPVDAEIDDVNRCKCPCERKRGTPMPLCSNLSDFDFMGPAVALFFYCVVVCLFLMLLTLLVYAAYAFVTNIMGDSKKLSSQLFLCNENLFCLYKVKATFKNKMTNSDLSMVQYWISVGVCVCWIAILRMMQYQGDQIQSRISSQNETPSDNAIKLENLPFGNNSESEIQECIRSKWLNRERKANENKQQIQIKSIHIVYDMKFVRELLVDVQEQSMSVFKMISRRTDRGLIKVKEEEYYVAKAELIRNIKFLEDTVKRFINEESYRRKLSTTCAIIEFWRPSDRENFLSRFGTSNETLLRQIVSSIKRKCFGEQKTILFKGNTLSVQQCPQSDDINWQNCEVKYSLGRVVGIWAVAFLIIILSLGIIVGLNYGQRTLNSSTVVNQNVITIINYIITFSIVIFNIILQAILTKLIALEYNHSVSDAMISMLTKTVFTQSINCIALPFISEVLTTKNYFGASGVSGVAFDFSISNSLVPVVLSLLNPVYLLKRLLLWIKCSRNFLIRWMCKGLDPKKNLQFVPSVNKFYEGGEMQLTQSYVQVVVMLLHMSFFSVMQPFIALIVCLGLGLLYFVKRYLLIRRYNYPKMVDKKVYESALSLLSYIPLIHGLGMAITIVITYDDYISQISLWIPCGVCLLFGFLNYTNPWKCFTLLTAAIMKPCNKKTTRNVEPEKSEVQLNSRIEENNQKFIPKCSKKKNGEEPNNPAGVFSEYYETNNLRTLFGYRNILEMGETDIADEKKLKEFVYSFGTRELNELVYPVEPKVSKDKKKGSPGFEY